MTRLAALVLLLGPDASGPPPAGSPLLAFAAVSAPGAEGRARAGVLDARTGRVLWSAEFDGGVNDARATVHGGLLAVLLNSRKEGFACHVVDLSTGLPRFRTEGAACVELPARGRRLLGFPSRDRMRVVDAATGSEAWSAPVTRHSALTILPDLLIAEGPRHLAAYALADGRPAWEREKGETDRLRVSGGRTWILKPSEPRLVELDPSTGRERAALDLPGPPVAIAPHPEFVDVVLEREIRRLHGRDLTLEWARPLPEPAVRATGDGRSIVVGAGADGDRVLLLDASTGRILANHPGSRFARSEESLRHPGYLVHSMTAPERGALLRVFDRRDGRMAWDGLVDEFEEDGGRDAILVRRDRRLLLVDLASRSERWSRPLDGAWRDTARRGDLLIVGTTGSISGLQASTGQEAWKLEMAPGAAQVHFSGKR